MYAIACDTGSLSPLDSCLSDVPPTYSITM